MKTSRLVGRFVTMVLGVLATRSPLYAQGWWQSTNSDGSWRTYKYVDLALTTESGHSAYPEFIPADGGFGSVKYLPLVLDNSGSSSGWCFDVGTSLPMKTPVGTEVPMDTRIWVDMKDGSYRSLSDDVDVANGNLYSRGRVYLKGGGSGVADSVTLLVAAYDDEQSDGHFGVWVERRNVAEADCTTGQTTIPWVSAKATAGGGFTLKLSTNAN
jgi:hypothetical protein